MAQNLPAEKLTVIPPGVPPAPASDVSRDELLRELQLPPNARLIGVIGRLVPEKRVQDLIWAADLLRVLHDNLRLLIIGDGPLRPQLEQYARLASDLDHIRFLGERDDVWRIMPHLDVLWNGSENRGMSIAILEAMAAGVPVIASDTPMNREFVVEGETGYLIPLGQRSGRADRARHTDRIFTDATNCRKAGCCRTPEGEKYFQFRRHGSAAYRNCTGIEPVSRGGAALITLGRGHRLGRMAGLSLALASTRAASTAHDRAQIQHREERWR